jgi:hypothetical protein
MKPVFLRNTVFQRVVYVVAGLALCLDALALVDFVLHPLATDHIFSSSLYRGLIVLVLLPLNLLIAFLIIKRVPGNIVGPLFIMWSGTVAFNSMRQDIGLVLFSAASGYDIVFGWMGLFLMFLHFPDGKIFSAKIERWVYPLLLVNLPVSFSIFTSMKTVNVSSPTPLMNRFFLPILGKFNGPITTIGLVFVMPLLVLIVISMVVRYRRGVGLERQQVKWLALFAFLLVIYTVPVLIIFPLLAGQEVMTPGSGILGLVFYFFCYMTPPAAIGIAVLRYRLWDIDRIIRRTVAYSILSVIITIIYFGVILTLQTLFTTLFHATTNTLAIVLSTLMIAAIFNRLRRRIQSVVDRRFFRKRYDAERIMEKFSATTRREVAIEPIAGELLRSIEETMQPEAASLWLHRAGEIHRPWREA